jgi:hypothetical protein
VSQSLALRRLFACILVVIGLVTSSLVLEAQTSATPGQDWQPYATPTPLPTVAPEMVRKAYMNCLLEIDRTEDSLELSHKARRAEVETQRLFCDNRKKDCTAKKDGLDCRTFVEEFTEE